jgi:hypothetical protein
MGIILISPFVTNFFLKIFAYHSDIEKKSNLRMKPLFSFSFLNVGLAQGVQNFIKFTPHKYQ